MRVKKLVGVFVALAITLMTAVIAVPSAAANGADEQFANRLYVLINDYRQQHGLAPLRLDPQMSADSQSWTQQSADIANTAGAGSFRHSPGSYAFHENIVWNMSADSAFQSWVNSAPHRANMLIAGATDIGIGAVELTAGPNRGTFLATAQFGWSKAPADAAAQAATLEAQRVTAEKAAAKAAADKAAADKAAADAAAADRAAAEKTAVDKAAAAQTIADKAAADKAAAEKAAADAANVAAPAAEEPAAPVQNEADQDKAAKEQAAQEAALKAANEAAAIKAAEDEAARQAELQVAADAAVAEQLAAEQAAADAAAAETAAVEAAAVEAEAAQAAEQAAAAQAAASRPAASRANSRQLQKPAAVLSQLDQVVLGNESPLTDEARGAVMASAAGSQLRISGVEPGSAVDAVIPSAGVNLGTVSADAKGELKLSVPPVLAAGEHKVALFTDGGLTGWASFTVEPAVTVLAAQSVQAGSGAELAVTGLNPAQIAIGGIGALMALIGAVALIAVQRQRSISAR